MSTVSDNLYDDLDITLCPSGGFCDKDYFDLAMLSSSFENDISPVNQDRDLAWKDWPSTTSNSPTPTSDLGSLEATEKETPGAQSPPSPKGTAESPGDEANKMRRRMQNRASQRAFRERKIAHTRSVIRQLDSLTAKHGELQRSYAQQNNLMGQLHDRIAELNAQLTALNNFQWTSDMRVNNHPCNWNSFNTFDTVSLPSTQSRSTYRNMNTSVNGNTRLGENELFVGMEKSPDFDDLLSLH